MAGDPRRNAVLLRDDSRGVATETKARNVQNGAGRRYRVSLNPSWLEQLNLSEQGARTVHSMSAGVQPVVVQNAAIIIQPASILDDMEGQDG